MKINREVKKVTRRQSPSLMSIACGTENPASIGCMFYELEGGEMAAVFTPGTLHESHKGIMHGGLSASVIDEVMGRTIMHTENREEGEEFMCMTAEMTVKYRKPVLIDKPTRAYGRIKKRDGVCIYVTADIVDEDDEILASGEGRFIKVAKKDGEGEERSSDYLPLTEKDPKEL